MGDRAAAAAGSAAVRSGSAAGRNGVRRFACGMAPRQASVRVRTDVLARTHALLTPGMFPYGCPPLEMCGKPG